MGVIALTAALAFLNVHLDDADVEDALCLVEAVHYEANGEGWSGKKAVANVVMTRADHPRFPSTFCSVLQAPSAFSHRDEGLSISDVVLTEPDDIESFDETLELVLVAMNDSLPDNTRGADHFYNPDLSNPSWASNPKSSVVILNHRFIRLY